MTDSARLRRAAAMPACNAILVKPNQVGTVSEAMAAVEAARAVHWGAREATHLGRPARLRQGREVEQGWAANATVAGVASGMKSFGFHQALQHLHY